MSIFELSPTEFAAFSTLVGFALLPGLNANQQNALGNFLMGVGQVLETAAAQQALSPAPSDDTRRIRQLEERLAALEELLSRD